MQAQMRSLLAVALGVVLAACGSGGGGKTTTPSTTTVPTPSATQLQARLLSVRDVGAGWKLGSPINAADLASIGKSVPCPGNALSPAVAERLTAVTGIQFEPTDHSYKHLIELVITGDPAQLANDLQSLFKAMDACATAASTAPGTRKVTVTKLQLPPLGDQQGGYAAAARVGSAHSSGIWYARNAAVRTGPVAVVLGLTEILAPQTRPQISDAAFVDLLRTAVGKLAP